jgi:hypothetical protein
MSIEVWNSTLATPDAITRKEQVLSKEDKILTVKERLDGVDDALVELGFVLKAIEELSIEKEIFTRAQIQNKIVELSAKGWTPPVSTDNHE